MAVDVLDHEVRRAGAAGAHVERGAHHDGAALRDQCVKLGQLAATAGEPRIAEVGDEEGARRGLVERHVSS